MSKKDKTIYKEGWLEFGCAASEYPVWERRLTQILTPRGCLFVGVVQRKKNYFAFYYYSPKLLEVDEWGELEATKSIRHNKSVGSICNAFHSVKPWEIMSAKEKEEDRNLVGHTYTYQDNSDLLSRAAEAIIVLSSMPTQKSKDVPPNYQCWRVIVEKWEDKTYYRCIKSVYNSRKLREYDENDLSFLVLYGAPQQLVVDQIKKKRTCAQKQVDKWNQTLKQIEEL